MLKDDFPQISSCSGTYRVCASQLAQNALPTFSPTFASRLKAYDLPLQLTPTVANSDFPNRQDLLNHIQNP